MLIPNLRAQGSRDNEFSKVEGLLINQVTGQPIPKGSITLVPSNFALGKQTEIKSRSQLRSVTSNEEGKFIIEQVELGIYTLKKLIGPDTSPPLTRLLVQAYFKC